ncbi:isoaspartyl peptidase/L-asparaginase [Roseiconus nitratireducens]|uniref:Isoaspartyl peptidase n=1 Tax=Roseiconus nitratireducens TaxID=2605748 RepID=A0A5M6D1M3_9BACT|nr:isoaspartyl peptidase/L-asparaginase [Roseiconus nitratireducens]KAA5541348.1 isoaspartyl peptidase/L-asparaginase [Roseiconus nitratireducens]
MKRFQTILALLFLHCLIMPDPSHAQSSKLQYAIVIHGGAGGLPTKEEWRVNRGAVLEQALSEGKQMLASGRSSLDTVEAVVRILEDSPWFNAGKGAVCNAEGKFELDATIMDGRDRSTGAVGCVRNVKNPISLARRVMTDTEHVLLVAAGADKFAEGYGDDPMIEVVPNKYFATETRVRQLERIREKERASDAESMGTVGCVALDSDGNLAAATSTGGLVNKKFGRLGDSPIAGAGTFADNATCAVSCTGVGEDYIRNAVAYDISARMRYRDQPMDQAIGEILAGDPNQVRGGIIAISQSGQIEMQFNTEGMGRAAADSTGRHEVHPAE